VRRQYESGQMTARQYFTGEAKEAYWSLRNLVAQTKQVESQKFSECALTAEQFLAFEFAYALVLLADVGRCIGDARFTGGCRV
jgi:hypothetical protein